MPFNNSKNGFQNEYAFVRLLNNKKLYELPYNLQLFILDLYGIIDKNDIIYCSKNVELQKYDIILTINSNVKRISIKKGIKNSVHTEPISELTHFLIENKMPKSMIIDFLRYHYADGTINGTGTKRISISEFKVQNQERIDEINKFINQEEILLKAIDRFIIKGRNSNEKIDSILYGVPEDFIWIKRDDIYKIIISKKSYYSTSIHFSVLSYQPLNRCLNHNSKYEKDRFISQIKWYNISDDIIENMNMLENEKIL